MCVEEHPMIPDRPVPEVWECLTAEQKKKVIVMIMDMRIKMLEMKIRRMEEMIELKKMFLANIRQTQEMIKSGK
jgi:hypothetical protein